MAFSFTSLITIAEEAAALEPVVEQGVVAAIAAAKSLLANPAVAELEALFASLFHLGTTTTATATAAVVTPTAAK